MADKAPAMTLDELRLILCDCVGDDAPVAPNSHDRICDAKFGVVLAALEATKREARIDEVKHSLYKGYFIPEMEVYAEDRIAQLSHPNQPKESSK